MYFKLTLYIFFAVIFSLGGLSTAYAIKPEVVLKMHYPTANIKKQTLVLSALEIKSIYKNTGQKLAVTKFGLFRVLVSKQLKAVGVIQSLKVRSKMAALLYIFEKHKKSFILKHTEVLVFLEPKEYLPRKVWIKQFFNKSLNDLHQFIKNKQAPIITGATLSSYVFFRSSLTAIAIIKLKFNN